MRFGRSSRPFARKMTNVRLLFIALQDGVLRYREVFPKTGGLTYSKTVFTFIYYSLHHPQLQETSEREKINEKYPSFELVLNFVRTDSLTIAQVSSLLEQRSDMAASVAQGYNYCADVIKTLGMENLFEVCSVLTRY